MKFHIEDFLLDNFFFFFIPIISCNFPASWDQLPISLFQSEIQLLLCS